MSVAVADADSSSESDSSKSLFWDSALVAAARDILFLALAFLYLIGFFFHAAWVNGFGVSVEFVDQPTWQMLEWAWDAVQIFPWMFVYLGILFTVFGVMSYAGYIRQTALAKKPRLRPIVYGLVFTAIIGGVALTIGAASHEGKRAALVLKSGGGNFAEPAVHFTAKSEAKTILEASSIAQNVHAKVQYYLIAESADRYHIFRRGDCKKVSAPAVYSILKADVISYSQAPAPDTPPPQKSLAQGGDEQPVLSAGPTPPADLLRDCP